MRVEADTSIHDLTDAEATDLRALCEAMLCGPVSLDHPLFVAWADVACPTHSQPAALLSVAFLPRALHALLRRAEQVEPLRVIGDGSLVRLTITTPDDWKEPLP